ncbi:MAG: hypothetical protein ACKO9B_02735 [Planctomycetota bacterium]
MPTALARASMAARSLSVPPARFMLATIVWSANCSRASPSAVLWWHSCPCDFM